MKKKENVGMSKKKIMFMVIVLLFIPFVSVYAKGGSQESGFRKGLRDQVQAHHEEQHQENVDFRQNLKNTDPKDRAEAIEQHRDEQFKENMDFRAQIHDERMHHLKDKLDKNDKLTAEQKKEALDFAEAQYQERVKFREQQHQESMDFMNKLSSDSSMSKEDKKKAMEDFRSKQKDENKAFREKMRDEAKAKHQEFEDDDDSDSK